MHSDSCCPRCGQVVRWIPPGNHRCGCTDAAQRASVRAKIPPAPRGVADPFVAFAAVQGKAKEAEPPTHVLEKLQQLQGASPTPATVVEAPAPETAVATVEPVAAVAVAEPATEAAPAKKKGGRA
jgi:hypothetical protein